MSKQFYRSINFRESSLALIDTMNGICDDYMAQGFVLTVRQLYYQLVARGIIPNTERSYKNTTSLANDARLAGLMDWDAIEDRTRAFSKRPRWDSGNEILASVAQQFHMDMWEDQPNRVFVIVEKEALAGVLEGVCRRFDMPLLAARGYPSGTVLREFANTDLDAAYAESQQPVILHLGDHDPSGIDMSRDLTERVELFSNGRGAVEFERIALNMPQIQQQKPPPNPAKVTDSRFESYRRLFGEESWELDALTPDYLVKLVEKHVRKYIDKDRWQDRVEEIAGIKERLEKVAEDFE
jgi:hypothetical protein